MKPTSLPADLIHEAYGRLDRAGAALPIPHAASGRRPVHTVYGGAHLFRADAVKKLGAAAIRAFEEYAPDHLQLAAILGLPGADALAASSPIAAFNAAYDDEPPATRRADWLAHAIHARVLEKLRRDPVEDLRIDFEDGYGARTDHEEDEHAVAAAAEIAEGMAGDTLPQSIGIRIKSLSAGDRARGVRTLDVFLTALARESGGLLPRGFVVTLPKITLPEQVTALADLLDALEAQLRFPAGAVKIELMVETPESLLGPDGIVVLPRLVALARGRCVAAHLGAYDYTASLGVAAVHQDLGHPACDFARHLMQLAGARTGIRLADGATTVLPIPPHRAAPGGHLGERQIEENHRVVHRAWRLHYDHVRRALAGGFYQGWDLHPAQIPARFAAVYAFFLEGMAPSAERLRNFVEKATRATRVGAAFDDAATGQGLLNFFLHGIAAGAFSEAEVVSATALALVELRGRSFAKIAEGRRGA